VHRFFIDPAAVTVRGSPPPAPAGVDAADRARPEEGFDRLVRFSAGQLHQMRRVLRLRPGDAVVAVVPGRPGEAGRELIVLLEGGGQGIIAEVGRVVGERPGLPPAPVAVTLFQGLPKGDRFELILQKGTELGVEAIVPVLTERAVARPRPDQVAAKLARWRAIAREAAEQCGRSDGPAVGTPVDWATACSLAGPLELALVPWEGEAAASLRDVLSSAEVTSPSTGLRGRRPRLGIMVGPEGGLSEGEIEVARRAGVRPVSLGPRILRSETAAIAAVAAVVYELGDLGRDPGDRGRRGR